MATIKCLSAYIVRVDKGHSCRLHSHNNTEFVLNLGCEGILQQGKRQFNYRDQTVFIYQPGVRHKIINKKMGYQICLHLSGLGADKLPEGIYSAERKTIDLFKEIEKILNRRGAPPSETELDLYTGLIIVELKKSIFQDKTTSESHNRLEKAKEYIDGSFNEQLNLKELASSVYLSTDHFRHVFKKKFGDSPLHYILKKKIEYAQTMLGRTEHSVKDIAIFCGIDNPYYFSRLFKNYTGKTPVQFRKTFVEK